MKTSVLFGIFVITVLPCASQTVILSEDFEGANPPSGWSRTQNTPSVGWEFGDFLGSEFFPIPAHTTYAASNDDAHDNDSGGANLADRDRLITPVLDLTPYSSTGAVLAFEYLQPRDYGSVGTVEVTTDGGSTWTSIYTVVPETDWTSATVSLLDYSADSTVQIAFRHNDNGQWGDGFAIDDVVVMTVPALDVRVDRVSMPTHIAMGPANITVEITNLSSTTITSIEAVYQVDSGAVVPGTIIGLNLNLGESIEVTHPVPHDFSSSGTRSVQFTATAVNGSTDNDPSNDSTTGTVSVLSRIPQKNVVLEVHTGAWCGWCPDGTVIMEEILATQPSTIAVAIHNGDAMSFADGDTISSTYIGGYPGGTVDRILFDGQPGVEVARNLWATFTAERGSHIVPVEVSLPSIAYSSATRTLNVDVQADFVGELSGDIRINCWVVEDRVLRSGSGYDQANYLNSIPGHPYYNAGDPIVGFEHNRVARAMLGGPWGTPGEIPGAVADGDSYSTSYTHVVPADHDELSLSLIGIVSLYDSDTNLRHILNAVEIPFESLLESAIFIDGFEGGTTSAWLSTVP